MDGGGSGNSGNSGDSAQIIMLLQDIIQLLRLMLDQMHWQMLVTAGTGTANFTAARPTTPRTPGP